MNINKDSSMAKKNIDLEYHREEEEKEEKDKIKKELIQSIISTKRQKDKENKDETKEIKLGRRLEERSNQKLSEKTYNSKI